MMMMVARLTSLGFNFYDGNGRKEDKLSDSQKEAMVRLVRRWWNSTDSGILLSQAATNSQ